MGQDDARAGFQAGQADAEELLAALERTVSHETARIELRFELSTRHLGWTQISRPGRQPSGGAPPRRVTGRFGDGLIRVTLWGTGRLLRRWVEGERPRAGVLDFEGQRCMYGDPSPSTAVLVVGDRTWNGPFPAAVESDGAAASTLQPLWLLDLVRGAVSAREQTPQLLDGRPCRRFSALADLNRAAEAVAYRLALPMGMKHLDDLTRIRAEVWVDDDGCIRRIRHTDETAGVPISTVTLDLIEFGVGLPAEWSRLPRVPDDVDAR